MKDGEVMIPYQLTDSEIQVIEILRDYNFGKLIVQKLGGHIITVERQETIRIKREPKK